MESDIIDTPNNEEVSKMPYLPCSGCGKPLEINAGGRDKWNEPNVGSNPSVISGTAICRHCSAATGFEITDNVQSFVSGKRTYGSLDPKVPKVAQAFLQKLSYVLEVHRQTQSLQCVEQLWKQCSMTGDSRLVT